MTDISVAMATYNGALYIERQLDSLAKQTLCPRELVITDDGSTDETLSMIEDFSKRSPFPVRLHRNVNRLGYRGNFVRNTTLCESRLIAFCDQDDVWHPEKLQRMSVPFKDSDVLLGYHNAQLVDGNGTRLGRANIAPVNPLNPPRSIHPFTWALGFLLVFDRSLVQFADLWPESVDTIEPHNPMAHDMWIYFLASVFGSIAFIDEDLVDYRQHGQNTVGFQWQSGSVWKRLRTKLDTGLSDYTRLAGAAQNRKKILDLAATRLEGKLLERATQASELYGEYAQRFQQRSTIYSSRSVTARVRSLWSLFRGGAYGSANTWGFSYESLAKDTLIAGFKNVLPSP